MSTLLQINASLHGAAGWSTRLANELTVALQAVDPTLRRIVRDVAHDPLPHLDADRFGAFLARPEDRTPAQRAAVAQSDALIDELRRADLIVLGLPMYNFGVPSPLKAYFDHIARAGVTFRYTAEGPVGLLGGRRAYVVATRGGRYPGGALDSESVYVRDFFGFLGMRDLELVYAEGLAMGPEEQERGLAVARKAIAELAVGARRAA